MWELDYKEKAEHRRIDAFEMWCWRRLLRVHWVFFGRNDAKAETPILWPPHAKSWLIGKNSDAERDWGQEEKGTTGDEMAGWHYWLDGLESEWSLEVGDGQGGLACCNSWGCKESDMTEWLNWTELNWTLYRGEISRVSIHSLDVLLSQFGTSLLFHVQF